MARKTRRKRGFVLITMAIAAVAIFGAIGMALDVGRAFVAKNETQAFCDTASLAAYAMSVPRKTVTACPLMSTRPPSRRTRTTPPRADA